MVEFVKGFFWGIAMEKPEKLELKYLSKIKKISKLNCKTEYGSENILLRLATNLNLNINEKKNISIPKVFFSRQFFV